MSVLEADSVELGYDGRTIVRVPRLAIEAGEFIVIVGPNGSGKSTLLRGLARALRPKAGAVLLDGQRIARLQPKEIAKRLALLPQSPVAPPDISVEELIWRGRHPHLGFFGVPKSVDREAVEWAIGATDLGALRHRPVGQLSGGERQRVWIAMALAQQPRILLLDEPTTYLDIGHQLEILSLLEGLNSEHGLTLVLVLQDLNQAARFARRLIVMQGGRIVADGPPTDILSARLLCEVFGVEGEVVRRDGHPPFVHAIRPAPRVNGA
ncbi:MAG: ABC transporter ATP-binding protein [Chloroflexota bacterium]|nr:ABC transporter ATP-binding protein [Dehalococcoidia bacterium]MDW8047345.1 ABC transporter ATP-binding protein [Chloroflexota bacterium]